MNHDPNTNTYQFRVIGDVGAGEELTICYGGGFLPRAERQSFLSKWGLECSCAACEDMAIEAKRVSMIEVYADLENEDWSKMNPETGAAVHKARLAKLQQLTGMMHSMGLAGLYLRK